MDRDLESRLRELLTKESSNSGGFHKEAVPALLARAGAFVAKAFSKATKPKPTYFQRAGTRFKNVMSGSSAPRRSGPLGLTKSAPGEGYKGFMGKFRQGLDATTALMPKRLGQAANYAVRSAAFRTAPGIGWGLIGGPALAKANKRAAKTRAIGAAAQRI